MDVLRQDLGIVHPFTPDGTCAYRPSWGTP